MKLYLIDPKKKWCKANLHCHTSNSDGFFSPSEIKKLYQEQGYEIVAFTDHEVIFDNSFLTDDKFIAITSSEFSLVDNEKPANSTYVDPNLKPSFKDAKVVHLNLYAKDPHNTFHVATRLDHIWERQIDLYKPNEIKCDGYDRYQLSQETLQETIDRANKAGFLVQFNHPNWSLNTRDDYINLKGLWGFEVFNYLTEIETGAEYCINIYDDMIRHGHNIVCTMGDDNHNAQGTLEGSFGGFNYIGVNKLTYDEVINAMEKGVIYASSGPIIKSLYIDNEEGKICIECSEATDIIFVGYNRTFRHFHGENLTNAEFKIIGNEVYFRLTVKDKFGRVAHTHVYFLKDFGY